MSIGNNGDFYIDTLNGDYYAKIAGVWVLKGNIMGPQGIQGIQGVQGIKGDPGAVIITADLLFGSGVPSNGLGVDTQVYVDQTNSDVYKKISGVWVLQTNIRGAAGPPGAQGIQGIQGVPGVDGNDGEQGPPGLPGAQGAPGSGVIGRDGLQGPPGTDGADGADGLPGPPGTAGTAGAQGVQGIQGFQGPPGNDGADGDDGLPGPPGPAGATGATGATGSAGSGGSGGATVTQQTYTYSSTTTDADPGNGVFRFDSATQLSIANLYIDLLDANANDTTTFLDAVPIAGRYVRSFVHFSDTSTPPKQCTYEVVSRTTAVGYRKFGLRPINVPGTFALVNTSNYTVTWSNIGVDAMATPTGTLSLVARAGYPGAMVLSTTTQVLAANTAHIFPLSIDRPMWIDSAKLVSVIARTTGGFRFLVYRATMTDGKFQPYGSPIYSGTKNTTFLATAANAFVSTTLGFVLEPGLYAIVLALDAGSGAQSQIAMLNCIFEGSMVPATTTTYNTIFWEQVNSVDWTVTAADPFTGTLASAGSQLLANNTFGALNPVPFQLVWWYI